MNRESSVDFLGSRSRYLLVLFLTNSGLFNPSGDTLNVQFLNLEHCVSVCTVNLKSDPVGLSLSTEFTGHNETSHYPPSLNLNPRDMSFNALFLMLHSDPHRLCHAFGGRDFIFQGQSTVLIAT